MNVRRAGDATVVVEHFSAMGNAFDRAMQRAASRESSRLAAANPDPNKVKRIPPRVQGQSPATSPYEQGVLDGLHGKAPAKDAATGRQIGAYLAGLNVGNRARLARSRREAQAKATVQQPTPRSIPSEEEIARELANREAVDAARKTRRQNSDLLQGLRAACQLGSGSPLI